MAERVAGGLLGQLALREQMVTRPQLEQALRLHGQFGNTKRLGDILLELRFIQPAQLERLLGLQRAYEEQLRGYVASAPVAASAPGGPIATSEATAATVATSAQATGPAQHKIERLLLAGARAGASDIHVHAGYPLQMRQCGQLITANNPPLSAAEAERDLLEILTPEQRERLLAAGELDFGFEIAGAVRARVGYCRTHRGGLDGVFRLVPLKIPTLDELGLPRILARFATFHQGIVLFTGPTGCGKSTTMAALLDMINGERKEHIITIEDPIEFVHPSKRCLVRQRQVISHTESFSRALRAALREDPDIIVVGELRDPETIGLAITAAETGHLVYGTLHTNNAVRSINRILDAFSGEQAGQIRSMVSESLRGIVSQRLLPTVDGRRRVAATEILWVNPAVSNMIREAKTFQLPGVMQMGKEQGMRLLDDSLAELVAQNLIAKDVAARQAERPERFK